MDPSSKLAKLKSLKTGKKDKDGSSKGGVEKEEKEWKKYKPKFARQLAAVQATMATNREDVIARLVGQSFDFDHFYKELTEISLKKKAIDDAVLKEKEQITLASNIPKMPVARSWVRQPKNGGGKENTEESGTLTRTYVTVPTHHRQTNINIVQTKGIDDFHSQVRSHAMHRHEVVFKGRERAPYGTETGMHTPYSSRKRGSRTPSTPTQIEPMVPEKDTNYKSKPTRSHKSPPHGMKEGAVQTTPSLQPQTDRATRGNASPASSRPQSPKPDGSQAKGMGKVVPKQAQSQEIEKPTVDPPVTLDPSSSDVSSDAYDEESFDTEGECKSEAHPSDQQQARPTAAQVDTGPSTPHDRQGPTNAGDGLDHLRTDDDIMNELVGDNGDCTSKNEGTNVIEEADATVKPHSPTSDAAAVDATAPAMPALVLEGGAKKSERKDPKMFDSLPDEQGAVSTHHQAMTWEALGEKEMSSAQEKVSSLLEDHLLCNLLANAPGVLSSQPATEDDIHAMGLQTLLKALEKHPHEPPEFEDKVLTLLERYLLDLSVVPPGMRATYEAVHDDENDTKLVKTTAHGPSAIVKPLKEVRKEEMEKAAATAIGALEKFLCDIVLTGQNDETSTADKSTPLQSGVMHKGKAGDSSHRQESPTPLGSQPGSPSPKPTPRRSGSEGQLLSELLSPRSAGASPSSSFSSSKGTATVERPNKKAGGSGEDQKGPNAMWGLPSWLMPKTSSGSSGTAPPKSSSSTTPSSSEMENSQQQQQQPIGLILTPIMAGGQFGAVGMAQYGVEPQPNPTQSAPQPHTHPYQPHPHLHLHPHTTVGAPAPHPHYPSPYPQYPYPSPYQQQPPYPDPTQPFPLAQQQQHQQPPQHHAPHTSVPPVSSYSSHGTIKQAPATSSSPTTQQQSSVSFSDGPTRTVLSQTAPGPAPTSETAPSDHRSHPDSGVGSTSNVSVLSSLESRQSASDRLDSSLLPPVDLSPPTVSQTTTPRKDESVITEVKSEPRALLDTTGATSKSDWDSGSLLGVDFQHRLSSKSPATRFSEDGKSAVDSAILAPPDIFEDTPDNLPSNSADEISDEDSIFESAAEPQQLASEARPLNPFKGEGKDLANKSDGDKGGISDSVVAAAAAGATMSTGAPPVLFHAPSEDSEFSSDRGAQGTEQNAPPPTSQGLKFFGGPVAAVRDRYAAMEDTLEGSADAAFASTGLNPMEAIPSTPSSVQPLDLSKLKGMSDPPLVGVPIAGSGGAGGSAGADSAMSKPSDTPMDPGSPFKSDGDVPPTAMIGPTTTSVAQRSDQAARNLESFIQTNTITTSSLAGMGAAGGSFERTQTKPPQLSSDLSSASSVKSSVESVLSVGEVSDALFSDGEVLDLPCGGEGNAPIGDETPSGSSAATEPSIGEIGEADIVASAVASKFESDSEGEISLPMPSAGSSAFAPNTVRSSVVSEGEIVGSRTASESGEEVYLRDSFESEESLLSEGEISLPM